jgi:2-methylcitrate dehydratase PrpD
MATASQTLAEFAANLKFAAIPPDAVRRAKDCLIDTVATATFGSQLRPWSRMIVDYGTRYGSGGPCSVIGYPEVHLHAPQAALANGVLAHAFDHDSVRDPSAGIHPGASLVPAVLAACEEMKADGKTAIAAFTAGCEVAFRIAAATHHSPEKLGFHAPGLTGPYGAAAAAGRVFGLDSQQMAHALGITGSLSAGILAFSKSRSGAMVKRLHFGRTAEAGILAARLAASGYAGPEEVLEGKFGFLDVYCRDADPEALTARLGSDWETLRICMKRYPTHLNAQTAVQSLRELMAEHAFGGKDVIKVVVEGHEALLTHHNIVEPADIMKGQYSVPFCVALALYRDPDEPRSFDASAVADPDIRAACRDVVELKARPQADLEAAARKQGGYSAKHTRIHVRLKDGREFSRDCDSFKGMPSNPFSRDDLRRKFMLLSAGAREEGASSRLFDHLDRIDSQEEIRLA